MEFHFLNVGNGDCHIIQHNSGRVSVIDINFLRSNFEGSSSNFNEESASLILERQGNHNQKENPEHPIEYLQNLLKSNSSIFRFILTHPDLDHMRGITDLFNEFNIQNFWDTENDKEIKEFQSDSDKADWDFYQKIRNSENDPKVLHLYRDSESKCCWEEDGIRILSPTPELVEEANKKEDWNMLSYVLLIEEDDLKIVLAGDSTDNTWDDIINHYKGKGEISLLENVDILVAPHHGRKSNTNYEFLKIMKPKLTLIGNAQSKDINYSIYEQYSDKKLTNNQAGNVVIQKDQDNGYWYVLITNKSFAEKNSEFDKLHAKKIAGKDYYYLWRLK